MPHSEFIRKLIHVGGGVAAPAAVLAFGWVGALTVAIFLLAYLGAAWEAHHAGEHVPIVSTLFAASLRPGETHPTDPFLFVVAAVVLGVLFPLPYVVGALGLLAVGDTAASAVGRRWGRRSLPWNPNKTWEGLAAGLVTGTVAYVGFAIVGGQLQGSGYSVANAWDESIGTSVVLVGIPIAFILLHAFTKHQPASAVSSAKLWGMFGAAWILAATFALTYPALFDGPLLPTLGGHGSLTQALLPLAAPVAMLVESKVNRWDNYLVPAVACVAAYSIVAMGNGFL